MRTYSKVRGHEDMNQGEYNKYMSEEEGFEFFLLNKYKAAEAEFSNLRTEACFNLIPAHML